jgi:hypothetical protein
MIKPQSTEGIDIALTCRYLKSGMKRNQASQCVDRVILGCLMWDRARCSFFRARHNGDKEGRDDRNAKATSVFYLEYLHNAEKITNPAQPTDS